MRLINTATYVLENFFNKPKPDYAVLSHRWTDSELTFCDISSSAVVGLPGFLKTKGVAQQARQDKLGHLWIDTCYIDKRNHIELNEAINSMYSLYRGAKRYYVYLHDIGKEIRTQLFGVSDWFNRGWTLQELLVPLELFSYDSKWQLLGSRFDLAGEVSRITCID